MRRQFRFRPLEEKDVGDVKVYEARKVRDVLRRLDIDLSSLIRELRRNRRRARFTR